MNYKIAVLPGDGIGPEVMREGTQVLNQAAKLHGFRVELEEGVVGGASIDAPWQAAHGIRFEAG